MMENRIEFNPSHRGKYILNIEKLVYKALVITGRIQGRITPEFGRLIQVRKKSGAFGSDTVLLRKANGDLHSFQNMDFYSVADEFLELYEAAMKEVDQTNYDHQELSYSICGKNEAKGFIVDGIDDTDDKIHSFLINIQTKN